MPRPPLTGRERDARRRALLDAAARIFDQEPYPYVQIAAVAAEAGVAKGTTYRYFASKEALFLTLAEEAYADWGAAAAARLDALRPPVAAADVVAALVDTFEARPRLVRLAAILHTVLEQNVDAETALSFKLALRAQFAAVGARLEGVLGFLKPGEGVRFLLRLHALLIGLGHMAEPAPVVAEVLRRPDMAAFHVELFPTLRDTLLVLLTGLSVRQFA